MQAASLYLGVRILAGAAGEPCYMASAERPSPEQLAVIEKECHLHQLGRFEETECGGCE